MCSFKLYIVSKTNTLFVIMKYVQCVDHETELETAYKQLFYLLKWLLMGRV